MALQTRLFYVLVLSLSFCVASYGKPPVPCYFVFGASYYDNGNNNGLVTTARSNFLPYGIDFPKGATGRFSNGRNTPDFLAKLLGFNSSIPPFAAVKDDKDMLIGVNYASGSSGIRSETGSHLGARYAMEAQLQHHQRTVSRIGEVLASGNSSAAKDHLSKCLYSVAMGDNDYVNNYFKPKFYSTSKKYTPEQYASVLVQEYELQLRTLHDHGARKIALIGIGPLGCAPVVVRKSTGTNGSSYVDEVNNSLQIFNSKLRPLVDKLNKALANAKFIYLDAFKIYSSLFSGFKVTNASCCEVIPGTPACIPLLTACTDRGNHFWWDALHPSEATNEKFASRLYSSKSSDEAYPFDISHLIQS
ncbi:hypothetical protein K2173_021799 [Erythroxylum novogranatense]|uniref:GDSL esterase/lipase n=1 Tax=Erythroxylum novogranatense TaxID=1862640 RepID=A0AAV8TXW6_9ROSI|nr:hypothetical protein K2173_021799 [Erythroxylum novogranatense]